MFGPFETAGGEGTEYRQGCFLTSIGCGFDRDGRRRPRNTLKSLAFVNLRVFSVAALVAESPHLNRRLNSPAQRRPASRTQPSANREHAHGKRHSFRDASLPRADQARPSAYCGRAALRPRRDHGSRSGDGECTLQLHGGSDGATPGYFRADNSGPGGTARALYGVAMDGGGQNANCPDMGNIPPGCGTIFKLAAPKQGQDVWNETTLWTFTGGKDEQNPDSAPVANSNRIGHATDLYGLTYGTPGRSGRANSGTVFRLTGNQLKTILKINGYKDDPAGFIGPVAIAGSGAVYATARDPSGKCSDSL